MVHELESRRLNPGRGKICLNSTASKSAECQSTSYLMGAGEGGNSTWE
jgi:hypothetical protein